MIHETEKYIDPDDQRGTASWEGLVSKRDLELGRKYADEYFIRSAELSDAYEEEFDELHKVYECRRDPVAGDPNFPKSFIPVITPAVEGQTASIVEAEIDFRHISNNPAHKPTMKKFDAASEYYRRKSQFKAKFKDCTRKYNLLGASWVFIDWTEGYAKNINKPNGHPTIVVPNLLDIIFDGSIKDPKDIQDSRYFIRRIGHVPISWARDKYGDKKADALLAGYNVESSEESVSYDDTSTFMLLEVWRRTDKSKNLQKIEMDANGFILEKSNPNKAYYKLVGNEYPLGIVRMMPRQGKFFGMGDGLMLLEIQHTVNKLVDELHLAARFNAQPYKFVDPASKIGKGQFTSNPADIIYAKDPHHNVLIADAPGVSPLLMQMVLMLLNIAQTATRFNNSMTGNTEGVSATATQINTQLAQGTVGIRDKKTDIANMMAWADMYCLKLCLEKWDKSFYLASGDSIEYIDPDSITQLPAAIPTTGAVIDDLLQQQRDGVKIDAIEDYTTTTDASGKLVLTDVDFETKVIIGDAMPKNRTDIYNIMLGLAQMQILNKETGQVESLVSPDRLREIMTDILGMKLITNSEEASGIKREFVQQVANSLNPVGQGNAVQTPTATPDNLQGTVPQMPDQDSRKVQI